jgi:hypothetical protein
MADSNSGYAILDGVFTVDARQDLGSKQRCENRLQELVEDGGIKSISMEVWLEQNEDRKGIMLT